MLDEIQMGILNINPSVYTVSRKTDATQYVISDSAELFAFQSFRDIAFSIIR